MYSVIVLNRFKSTYLNLMNVANNKSDIRYLEKMVTVIRPMIFARN